MEAGGFVEKNIKNVKKVLALLSDIWYSNMAVGKRHNMRMWRNWQTRTVQVRVDIASVEVRILSSAPTKRARYFMYLALLIYTEDSNLKRRERKMRWSGGPSNSERSKPTEEGGEGRGLQSKPVNPLIRTNEKN